MQRHNPNTKPKAQGLVKNPALKMVLIHLHTILFFLFLLILAVDVGANQSKYVNFALLVNSLIFEGTMYFVVIMFIIVTVIVAGYFMIWRMFFPDFIRDTDEVENMEGRIYWIEGLYFVNPKPGPEDEVRIWFQRNWPWNIFFPLKSLYTLSGVKVKNIYRKSTREAIVEIDGKITGRKMDYRVTPGDMVATEMQVYHSRDLLKTAGMQCAEDTLQTLKASPMVLEKIMSETLIEVDPGLVALQNMDAVKRRQEYSLKS